MTTTDHALQEWRSARGARVGQLRGAEVALGFGERRDELGLIRGGPGICERGAWALVELWGEDRVRLLNGLVTNDVARLAEGECQTALFTDLKGRILADAVVAALPDRLLLELPPGQGEPIATHLQRYIIVDRVEVAVADRAAVTVFGDDPLPFEGPAPSEARPVVETRLAGGSAVAVRRAFVGEPAVTAWLEPRELASALAALERWATELGGGLVGHEAVETVRVENGRPAFGAELGPTVFPQESGLEAEAVAYDKGCYLGQEVVARIHYRGGVNRALRGLRFPSELPPQGAELRLDERPVGHVSSLADSPRLGAIGLSVVHLRATPGTDVAVEGGGSARVVELPFGSSA